MVDCTQCFKYRNPLTPKECRFCNESGFKESVLCELLRENAEGGIEVECSAYKPNLAVVGEARIVQEVVEDADTKGELSDLQKWFKAYALQQWKTDPDRIFANLNFHVCLLASKRQKLFTGIKDRLGELSPKLDSSMDQDGQSINILSAGHDHIHLHGSLSPQHVPHDVVMMVMKSLHDTLGSKFTGLSDHRTLFEEAYFIETMG